MADLIFCGVCDQDVSHDGAYVIAGQAGFPAQPLHRCCFVDGMSDAARDLGEAEVTAKFVAGPNFDPNA